MHDCLHFVSLQRDEATRHCRELSQELVNLRGELGKLGHLGHTHQLCLKLLSPKYTLLVLGLLLVYMTRFGTRWYR